PSPAAPADRVGTATQRPRQQPPSPTLVEFLEPGQQTELGQGHAPQARPARQALRGGKLPKCEKAWETLMNGQPDHFDSRTSTGHSLTRASFAPVTSQRPSGEKATVLMPLWCQRKVPSNLPSAARRSRKQPSPPTAASTRLSGEKASPP